MSGIKIALGGALLKPDNIEEQFNVLEAHGVKILDTAQIYGDSERVLGDASACSRFIVDTKLPGGIQIESLSPERITAGIDESLARLKTDKVDILYIHSPPGDKVPVSTYLPPLNTAYHAGKFARLGVSNYKASELRALHAYAVENNLVRPSVYQGNYNPVARKQEELLFPTLRELGMSFYAYSPLAGGFLTKTKKQLLDTSESGMESRGRFDEKSPLAFMYRTLYYKPAYLDALDEWDAIAAEAGISKAELANRWVRFNSALRPEQGDAIIIGANTTERLEATLVGLEKGPLGEEIARRIDAVWKSVEHEAGLDNVNLDNVD